MRRHAIDGRRERSPLWVALLGAVLLWTLGGLAAPATADAEVIDRIVARVNDEIITKYELEQAVTPFLLQQGMQPSVLEDPERREEIHQKVLDELIERKLLLEQARELELSVNDQQVDQWMAMTRRKQGMSKEQFKKVVENYGMSYERYRETVRMNLLKIRLVKVKLGRQISVSDDEVEKAYREQFGDVGGQETHISLRQILVQPDSEEEADEKAARKRANKILKKLKKGTSFQELAKQFSDGPAAEKGGMLGTFAKGELNPALRDTAWKLDEGEHSEVVRTKFGFHILKVDAVEKKGSTDVEKRKKMIRQKLRQKKMQEQLDSYVSKLRKRAFVDVKM